MKCKGHEKAEGGSIPLLDFTGSPSGGGGSSFSISCANVALSITGLQPPQYFIPINFIIVF